jgi:hypothetical protein
VADASAPHAAVDEAVWMNRLLEMEGILVSWCNLGFHLRQPED